MENPSKQIVAKKLEYYRKLKRWSQSQVAKKIGILRNRYVNYECARTTTPYHIIRDLCRLYQISVDEFEKLKIPVLP